MSVEILSVSLSDESIDRLADAVARRLGSQAVTQSNYPSPEVQGAPSGHVSQQGPDPWQGGVGVTQVQQVQAPSQATVQQPQTNAPMCAHGAMRFVPAGFSNSSGRAYAAFWGCPAPRGAQQCKSVKANQ